jgi:hypothetical protein
MRSSATDTVAERQPVATPAFDDARRGLAPSKWTTTVV